MQFLRRVGTIWTVSLDESTPDIVPLVSATFCRLGPESADELAEAMGESLEEVHQRLMSGRHCYAARVSGNLASYGWVSFEDEFIGEINQHLHLLPGEAYIWNCVTLPAFRQKHLYTALLVTIVRELQKECISRIWIGADYDNTPSQHGIAHAGFTHVADLMVGKVLPLRSSWLQAQPGVPGSMLAEARRAFLNRSNPFWLRAFLFVMGKHV
jgi:hypothetical protein